MPSQWTTDKPTEPGKYRMRDKVFGWGPIEVEVWWVEDSMAKWLGVKPAGEPDGHTVMLSGVSNWIEWRLNDG